MLKYTTEYVREFLEKIGWKMLSNEYTGYNKPIAVMCPNKHVQKKLFKDIVGGGKCMKCHYLSGKAGKPTHKYEYVKEFVEKEGYHLLSKTYKRQSDLLEMSCKNEHKCYISFKKFKTGRRCRYCDPSRKMEFDEICLRAIEFGFKILDTEYSPKKKLHIECVNGHVMEKYWNNFHHKPACGECHNPYKNMTREEYRKMYNVTDKGIYSRYSGDCNRTNRLKRGIQMQLTFEQFSEIINKNCSYCGSLNCRGVDRKDSSGNYDLENSVPCCKYCNSMKNSMTVEEFLKHIEKIAKHSLI